VGSVHGLDVVVPPGFSNSSVYKTIKCDSAPVEVDCETEN